MELREIVDAIHTLRHVRNVEDHALRLETRRNMQEFAQARIAGLDVALTLLTREYEALKAE